jgi:phage I-like protein
MTEHYTSAALEVHFKKADKAGIRWHPVLADHPFEKAGRKIPVTEGTLNNMAELLRSGALGKRRPITMPIGDKAHPELASAPAEGWIMSDRVRVGEYKDGRKALYVGVKWGDRALKAIEDESYAYISPVFTENYLDQEGQERGPALLGAGLVNDPHWTSQEPLFDQFCAALMEIETFVWEEKGKEIWHRLREPGAYKIFRRKEITKGVSVVLGQRKDDPDQWEAQALRFDRKQFTLAEAKAWASKHKMAALERAAIEEDSDMTNTGSPAAEPIQDGALEALQAENASLKEKLEAAEQQQTEFAADRDQKLTQLSDENTVLRDEVKTIKESLAKDKGDGLIAKYSASGHVQHKHLFTDEGEPKKLYTMAYEAPETFIEIVESLAVVSLQTDPVGGTGAEDPEIDDQQKVLEMAKAYCNKHREAAFDTTYLKAQAAFADGRTLED